MKLALDAGHGFNTAGKRTPDDIREWTLNNRVLRAFLDEIKNYKIDVIRTDDPTGKTDVTLNQRDQIAKQGDVFLSIHHNAFRGTWGDHGGTETLIQSGKEHSRAYATAMNDSIVKTLGLRNRGIKAGNTQVLRNFNTGPSCLVEVGFMDSNTDRIIREPEASARVGKNLATDFAKFFKLEKVSGGSVSKEEPIEGSSKATVDEMVNYVKKENKDFNPEIAKAFLSVGDKYGVRGDVAFAQSILETGWFKFTGSAVTIDQNNFCGMGVTSRGMKGDSFASIEEGVRAQIQHLYAYANKKELPSGEVLVDPRFKYVTRGVAPTWAGLNGKWATGAGYGEKILKIYSEMDVSGAPTPSPTPTPVAPKKSVAEVAQEIVSAKGGWGNNPGRQQKLEAAGYNYNEVKNAVDALMAGKKPAPVAPPKPARKSNEEIAKEVLAGKWGNNPKRKADLEKAGYNYDAIQGIVNNRPAAPKPPLKSNQEVANEVKLGRWGNGAERVRRLKEAGYDAKAIQDIVDADKGKKPANNIVVGSKVKIKQGSFYQGSAKGKPVSAYAYSKVWTVSKISNGNALLSEINSWLAIEDLVKVN